MPTCSRPAGRYWKTECGAELALPLPRPLLRLPRARRASDSAGGGPAAGGPALWGAATSVMLYWGIASRASGLCCGWRPPWRLSSATPPGGPARRTMLLSKLC